MIFGFVCAAFNAAASFVSSAISAIGSLVTTIAPIIANALDKVVEVIDMITKILGILKPDENLEGMGDRALQAADEGITPDKFDQYNDYLDAIRNFELDPEKSTKYKPEEKQLAGIGIALKSIEQKYGLNDGTGVMLTTMITADSNYFNANRITSWLETRMPVEEIIQYFDGKLDPVEAVEIEEKLIEHEQQLTSEDETIISAEIAEAREAVQN